MAGKHEAPGTGEFWAGLVRHATMIVLVVGVVLALVFAVVKVLPDWFPSEAAQPSTPIVISTSSTTSTTVDVIAQPTRTTSTITGTPVPTTVGSSTTTSVAASSTSTTSTTVSTTERSPAEITVKVLNSTRSSGLAAGLTADLAAAGYQMEEQDNYSPTQVDNFIYYAPGYQSEALTLQGLISGTKVAENPAAAPSADLLVILGTSYSG